MSVRIIVDSTADLRSEIKERFAIVPMTVHFGDEEYIDGVTIDQKTFYEKLIEGSSDPAEYVNRMYDFVEEFHDRFNAGKSNQDVLTLSSQIQNSN